MWPLTAHNLALPGPGCRVPVQQRMWERGALTSRQMLWRRSGRRGALPGGSAASRYRCVWNSCVCERGDSLSASLSYAYALPGNFRVQAYTTGSLHPGA